MARICEAIPCPCHEIASSKTPRNDSFGDVIPVTIIIHFSLNAMYFSRSFPSRQMASMPSPGVRRIKEDVCQKTS